MQHHAMDDHQSDDRARSKELQEEEYDVHSKVALLRVVQCEWNFFLFLVKHLGRMCFGGYFVCVQWCVFTRYS